MLNTFQLSIQNTQRCYNEIESDGMLYKIDSYILDFSEKTDKDNSDLAKQLRKVNMAVVPLMPLMLKNNNLMSEYVVRYPQKQMTDSLKDIIRNKRRVGEKSYWVWDKDGYNAITNYYYIDALISFYRYYEKFEEPFIDTEETNKIRESEKLAIKEAEAQTALANQENEYKAKLRRKEEYISEIRDLGKGLAKLVINGLIDLVDEQITPENLIGVLTEDEKFNKEKVIEQLNSKNGEGETVKLSKLIRLSEKLQILSLLSMGNYDVITSLLQKGSSDGWADPNSIIKNVFSNDGGTPKFMANVIASLAGLVGSGENDKQE